MKFEVIHKTTVEPLYVGSTFNNKMIVDMFYHMNKDLLTIIDENKDEHVINGNNLIFLFYLKEGVKQYDYIVDLRSFDLIKISCDNPVNLDYSIVLGNYYLDPQLTIIYNKTKKYMYDKNSDIIIKEYDGIKYVFKIDEKLEFYYYHDFFSEKDVKPLISCDTSCPTELKLINDKTISSRLQNVDLSQYSDLSFYKKNHITINPLLVDFHNIVETLLFNNPVKYKINDNSISSNKFLEISLIFKRFVSIVDVSQKIFSTKYPIEKFIYGTDKIERVQ